MEPDGAADADVFARPDARAGRPPGVSDDWSDALGALADAGARFLVVGAHAMAVHGVPRGTQDLDIWIDPSEENVERVWRGLAAFGAPLGELGGSCRPEGTKGDVERTERVRCRLDQALRVLNQMAQQIH